MILITVQHLEVPVTLDIIVSIKDFFKEHRTFTNKEELIEKAETAQYKSRSTEKIKSLSYK